jgi:hypothetical protein
MTKLSKKGDVMKEKNRPDTRDDRPKRRVPRRDQVRDEDLDAMLDEQALDPLGFHDEVEAIDPFDDLLDDGRIKYRALAEAYREYRRQREQEDGGDEI